MINTLLCLSVVAVVSVSVSVSVCVADADVLRVQRHVVLLYCHVVCWLLPALTGVPLVQ